MNAARFSLPPRPPSPHDRTSSAWTIAVAAVCLGLSCNGSVGRAQSPDADAPGVDVLTRGPVHEAFASMVTFNPEPGMVVTKAPPNVIEEMPPAERPPGDNVAWIPGYWGWDDERNDFLWISGTWRALPPGRAWMAGYWGQTQQGYQWISGYWSDANARETTYLPPPPATVEAGPNIAAPSSDYGWTPGCWIWYRGRYAWRPGYWTQVQADWDWIPAHYVWTPRGYIFVEGFWDYPVERRGLLFAPVYFESGFSFRRGYVYSPTIVINLAVFSDYLFLRPSYQHYYFGDYYASGYERSGFYASLSFQTSRSGYDPFYSRQRWEHRQDRDWSHRVEATYQDRRDHEASRPPRTWTAQRSLSSGPTASQPNRVVVATSIDQLAKSTTGPTRFQPVARAERQQLVQRGQEVQRSRDQRRTLEARPEDTSGRKPGGAIEPAKVQQPRSPIVAKPANRLGRNLAPPKAPQAPRPDLKVEPRVEAPARQPNVERGNPQPEPRRIEFEKKSPPGRGEVNSRERGTQPKAEPRTQPAAAKAQDPARQNAKALDEHAPAESAEPAKDEPAAEAKDAEKSANKNQDREGKGKKPSPSDNPHGP